MVGDEEDDDGFLGYVPTTVDLGPSLVVFVVFAFIIGYGVILPFFVILTRRRQARQKAANETYLVNDLEEEEDTGPADATRVIVDTTELHQNSNENEEEEEGGSVAQSAASSHSSVLSSAVAAILDHQPVPRSKAGRKRRRRKEKDLQDASRWSVNQQDAPCDNNNNNNNNNLDLDVRYFTLLGGIYPHAIQPGSSGDPPGNRASSAIKESHCEDEAEPFVEGNAAKREASSAADRITSAQNPHSCLQDNPPAKRKPRYGEDYDTLGTLDKIGMIAAWDVETKRIIRLATPYCTQALFTGFTDTANVAIVGNLIGTKEVSAYVITNLLVELTSDFVGGLHESLATLCSQAIGANNKKLAGEYCQIVVILYTLFFLPFMLLWAVYMGPTLEWMGFDPETVEIGKQYNYILVVDLMIDGLGEAVHGLLDVGGFEKFSTLIGATEEIVATLTLLFVALFGQPDLVTVGLIQLFLGVLFLGLNLVVIYWRGWFRPYREGLIGTFALFNWHAVCLVARTALSLSIGMLLTDGEWEILTIFASFLGPAEVAAWGILDTIWSATHELIDGVADAGEVRCAYLLGSVDPCRAKVSAYKSLFAGTFGALYLMSFIYIAGDDLPTWLTSDATLQKLLRDLLPLFGFGNFVMAFDTMAWTLLGSQGRYRLATIIVCLASWCVTIPFSALFSVHFNVNLQGQMTAYICGFVVMGMTHSYFLLVSNWAKLSEIAQEEHETIRLMSQEQPPTNSTHTSNTPPASPSISISSGASPKMLPIEISSGGKPPSAGSEERC